ncbi:MAG: hypothetical protein EPGJADBJ_04759 [Saprospiraceae bacterium]|nr:hypothetical protein [Saprospiraceae bacterium]
MTPRLAVGNEKGAEINERLDFFGHPLRHLGQDDARPAVPDEDDRLFVFFKDFADGGHIFFMANPM